MVLAAHLIPHWFNVAVATILLACSAAAAWTAPWKALRAAPERQHVLLGGLLALLLLWLLTFQLNAGVWVHLLGMTSLTLVVGWRFAVLGGTLALLGHLWWLQQSLLAGPVAWLFTVLIPATTTRILAHLLRRHGLRNIFVYMLGAGFGGGLLSVLAVAALALPTLALIGQSGLAARALENSSFIALLMFPEGFVNGMLVTAFTVFYPDVVKTFDDDYYLDD